MDTIQIAQTLTGFCTPIKSFTIKDKCKFARPVTKFEKVRHNYIYFPELGIKDADLKPIGQISVYKNKVFKYTFSTKEFIKYFTSNIVLK
jgi:hypothetical protein